MADSTLQPDKYFAAEEAAKYRSYQLTQPRRRGRIVLRVLVILFFLASASLFLPWTQTLDLSGKVTALQPGQRPQDLNSVIGGRIEKWYVQEGDFVRKGDTLLYLSEVKDEYFDPQLLNRTMDQITAKESSAGSYSDKAMAIDRQINALLTGRDLKMKQAVNYLEQARLKVITDSTDLAAAKVQTEVAMRQLTAMEDLYRQGLRSLTDMEARRLKWQEAMAKQVSAENKWLASRNALLNAQMEISTIQSEYEDKLAKAESEKYASLSAMFDAEATVTKMQNQYMNYSMRRQLYFVTAPQDGYITKAIKTGVGEQLKEGEPILTIMPANVEFAAELFVSPLDLPLLERGSKVQLIFDGWPAFVISGWPSASTGTFPATVFSIDRFISDNGKYRILVVPDGSEKTWPAELRIGTGVKGIALLKDVTLGYEIWRRLNGFPPEFYEDADKEGEKGAEKPGKTTKNWIKKK